MSEKYPGEKMRLPVDQAAYAPIIRRPRLRDAVLFMAAGFTIAMVVAAIASSIVHQPSPHITHVGPGYVRSIDWVERGFVFESDDTHYVHVIRPCYKAGDLTMLLPVWQGMHAEIWYSAVNDDADPGSGCNRIIAIRHEPPDDKEAVDVQGR